MTARDDRFDVHGDDLALEAELRAAAALFDPVPAPLRQAAVDAFDLRGIDAELAELVFDSSLELAVVRGDQEPRVLTFQTGDLVVEVELSETGGARRLVGQLIPAGPQQLELRSPYGTVPVRVDERGHFATPLDPGPFSLRCRWPGRLHSKQMITDWVAG